VGAGVEAYINGLGNILAELFSTNNAKFVYAEPKVGDIKRSSADLSKAERLLGYKPKVSLKEGLAMLLRE
jgi:nucleoside-diphosphate-sugar epimerase